MAAVVAVLASLGAWDLSLGRRSDAADRDDRTGIAAVVGAERISVEEVRRMAELATGGRELSPSLRPTVEAQVLEEIVARRLVMAYAKRTRTTVANEEIERAMEVRKRAAGGAAGSDDARLRRETAWQLQWHVYLDRYATQPRLEEYFEAHRRELDGTEMSVSHILLRAADTRSSKDVEPLIAETKKLRAEILAGSITFAEAARRSSRGPSAADGGKLGRIGRHGPMVEAFSAAAFALAPGEISPPIVTPFGVHLIRCDEVHPGGKSLADVREEVLAALGRELLEKLAALERRSTPVEYTGQTAYFDPTTKRLVESGPVSR